MLEEKVTILKGIGTETAESLQEMGIVTIADLLSFFPFRYEDNRVVDVVQAKHEDRITVSGYVQTLPVVSFYGRNKSRLSFKLQTGQNLIQVTAFNQAFLKNKLLLNEAVVVTGKWDRRRLAITANSIKKAANATTTAFEPVYHVKGSITVKLLRKWIAQAFAIAEDDIEETMPASLLEKYRLVDRKSGLRYLHFPENEQEVKQANRRFVYEELFMFQLKMQALRKVIRENNNGMERKVNYQLVNQFVQSLPFELTDAQKKVVKEILQDIQSPQCMNRLLQGDVGSGKTIVAMIAILATVSAGCQATLMAPTEILAEQHYQSVVKFFPQKEEADLFSLANINLSVEQNEHKTNFDYPLCIALLTASIKGKKRKQILESLAQGEIDLLIGTHSLIQDEVVFADLGLVITDEQHRFGVEQRRILREKGENPDSLFMTATPIPRTLAITVFGEMDVSVMNELPAGRKLIETKWVKPISIPQILTFLAKEISKGRQAYVICPLIEESEKLDFENVVNVYSQLTQFFPTTVKVGLMHGRLSSAEKDEMMHDFAAGRVDVLVSTTVVEVGVNVPNASCMVIYDAERFGLSQLHQLRGRVGRGDMQSYCFLIADPKNEMGVERLNILCETNDGFILSEKDLALRGPGDFFGKKQSGLPEFKLADIVHDFHILEIARDDATALIQSNAFWEKEEYHCLRRQLSQSGILEGGRLD